MRSSFYNMIVDRFERLVELHQLQMSDLGLESKVYRDGFKHLLNRVDKVCPHLRTRFGCVEVLDFGAGSGFTSIVMAKKGYDVTAVDFYSQHKGENVSVFNRRGQDFQQAFWDSLALMSSRLRFGFYDGKKLPFPSKTFHMVMMHAVLEHITWMEQPAILKELRRILMDNGILVIARTPLWSSWVEKCFETHERRFTKDDIVELLQRSGFEVVDYATTDFFPEYSPRKMKWLQCLMNRFSWVFYSLSWLLDKTWLRVFAHHHQIIARSICAK